MSSKFPRVLLLLLAALPLFAQDRDSHNGHEVAASQVILKLKGPTAAVLQQLTQLGDADDVRALNSTLSLYLLHSRSGTVAALLAVLQTHPSVTYVEPDYIVKTNTTPNDPNFSQQWSFSNTSMPGADIGALSAWDISTGSAANVVGVVDTGIDYTHPDLAANVWFAPAPFTVTMSWGQLTCPAGSHGYNAIARSCDPRDDNQHGTHVSGTIGAIGNNALGVAGVNWTTRIMGLKFLDASGSGTTSDAIDAMEFAMQAKTVFGAAANVRVLSNSWGGAGFSQGLLDEINKANSDEMLFVVAAGNSSQNVDTTPQYPAAYSAPNIVSVAATTNSDTLASFSSWGHTAIHLGAPGVNILSTLPGSAYGYLSGTSMATPHVSGAAMLVLSKCTLTTAALKNVLLSNVDPLASLAGITVTGGRLNVNKALRSCSGLTGTSGTAAFVKTDNTTSGTWKGVYGAEGSNVIGDTSSYPAWVTVAPSGISGWTWAASTADVRAPQKVSSATDRVAACWYSGSEAIDLKFTDSNIHQVALYLLDWDNLGRSERVDVLDPTTNAVLDTRSVSGFSGGQYLVWNLSGHVVIRVTNTSGGPNAVMSGLFFGTGGSISPPPSGTAAAFVRTDNTTSGTWKGFYGRDGANIIGDTASYPAYVTVAPSGMSGWTWAASTADVRAPQKVSSATDRVAACWYSGSMAIDLKFTDSNTHQFALYLLDWDNFGRSERVDVLDAITNAVLDTRSVSGFNGGQYLVWNFSGHVVIRVTNTSGAPNAVISGLFFGTGGSGPPPPSTAAAFVKTDITTSGTWKNVYGLDGANVIGDTSTYPAYVTVTPAGNLAFTWAASTTDTRALQKASSTTDRIAACWYSPSAFTFDMTLNDANTHQLALYLWDVDGYGGGRNERVDILDASTNAVLDTRSVAGFSAGRYLVWNVSGHVTVRITNNNPSSNAVLAGIFFR